MRTAVDEETGSTAAFELAAGCVVVVATACFIAAAFGPADRVARLVIMAVVVGLLALNVREARACAGIAVVAALVFVGFLAHRDGQLTGNPASWMSTVVIGLADLAGRGPRWIHRLAGAPGVEPRTPMALAGRPSAGPSRY
jgi:hypothetical protein